MGKNQIYSIFYWLNTDNFIRQLLLDAGVRQQVGTIQTLLTGLHQVAAAGDKFEPRTCFNICCYDIMVVNDECYRSYISSSSDLLCLTTSRTLSSVTVASTPSRCPAPAPPPSR